MTKVLVTGASGFLAGHTIVQLLDAGFEVRGTLRTMARAEDVRRMVRAGGADPATLELVSADLEQDEGWTEAVKGCDRVLHMASPFPEVQPDDEQAVIRPARDGTLRVLRAAQAAGVKRVVMTSSFGAVGYGHPPRDAPFDETDWSIEDAPGIQPYIRSKIASERAAWEFAENNPSGPELSVINPTGMFGPVLGPDYAASVALIRSMLDGKLKAAPRVTFGIVDVRDVATLHIAAMEAPAAVGQRFIAVAGEPLSMVEVGALLRRNLGAAAARAPRRQMPDWMVRAMARLMPPLREVLPQLGIVRRASSGKAKRVLGWTPRSPEQTITDCAKSLLALPGQAR